MLTPADTNTFAVSPHSDNKLFSFGRTMSNSTKPHPHTLQSFNLLSLSPHVTHDRVDVPPFCIEHSLSPRLRLVCFGDSLTQQAALPDGWCTLLSARYQRRADLFNRGYSGYTSRNTLTTLTQHLRAGIWPFVPSASLPSSSPASPAYSQLVTLCLGANDAALPSVDGGFTLHVPLDSFTSNVRRIIELLLPEYAQLAAPPSHYLSTTTALVLITPPQIDEPAWRQFLAKRDNIPAVKGRDNAVTGQYAAAIQAIAADWHIPVIDLYSLTPPTASDTWPYFSDGLHLNADGNARLFRAIVDCVERCYPSLSVEQLRMDAPPFEGWAYGDDATGEQKWPHGESNGQEASRESR